MASKGKRKNRPCVSCARGFYAECERGGKCLKNDKPIVIKGRTAKESTNRKHGGTARQLIDPLSTGRKRAKELYPLDKNAPCEWREKRNCGGGKRPIIGCVDGFQAARHHGPVKDTTKNHEGNVHRICHKCHNHWHELNDLLYNEREYALLPHDPSVATPEELVMNELAWRSGKMGKDYELASSRNKLDKLS